MLDVAAVHASAQTKVRIVRHEDSFFLDIVRLYRHDRPEDLFTDNGHFRRHIGEDCRIDEESTVEVCRTPTFDQNLPALLNPLRDVTQDPIELTGVEHRTNLCPRIPRVADPEAPNRSNISIGDLIHA